MKVITRDVIDGADKSVVPLVAAHLQVKKAGVSVTVVGATAVGGYIINPKDAAHQGLKFAEVLYVDPTGPANTFEIGSTVAIKPGDYYILPANVFTGVWVNSNADGHRFTAVQIKPVALVGDSQDKLDAVYVKGDFPPTKPTGLLRSIESYLYQEYSLDDDLQGFVKAYNDMQQDIVDTFNGLNLPNYTQYPVSGPLLDWVAEGVYGYRRPVLSSGRYFTLGPYNTLQYNQFGLSPSGGYIQSEYNCWELIYPDTVQVTNDDIFRRILTWHISKQDCKYFSIAWLKKRVMRFLIGVDGKHPNIDQHYQVSVTAGPNNDVSIRFILIDRFVTGGALYDFQGSRLLDYPPFGAGNYKTIPFQYNSYMYNEIQTDFITYPPLPNMEEFREAVLGGVLELPFQYKFTVVIG
jgi:hypothetical protein